MNFENVLKKLLIGTVLLLVVGLICSVIGGGNYHNIFSILGSGACIISVVVLGLTLYFLPAIMAYKNGHESRQVILLIDFLFGWTLIGWLASLIWACVKNDNKEVINGNKYEDLARLQKLKDSGTITEVEFEIEKQKLLR